MKKILTTILSLVFILTCLFSAAVVAEEAVGEYKAEERDLLIALSVVSEAQVAKGTESKTVTRGEIADMLTVLSVCPGEPTGFTGYDDVDDTHASYNGISWSTVLGLMNGYGDGTFRPDVEITYNELATVLLRVMGYNAAIKGADIDAYATAATLKIFAKVQGSITRDALVTRVNLVTAIYNAIHTDMMKQSGYGANEVYAVAEGCTILTENFKVFYNTGIIDKNSFTALDPKLAPAAKDSVTINGAAYLAGDTQAEDLLGYRVKFYWQTGLSGTIENKLIYVNEKGLNEVLTIEGDDIAGTIDPSNISRVKYYDEKDNLEEEIIPASADFLYNDLPAAPTATTMDIDVGKITFINNGTSKDWTMVKVENYQTLAVESSDITNGAIYSKYDTVADLDYDPDEINESVFFYDKDGNPSDPAVVSEWDVLSIKKDVDGKKMSVYVTVSEMTGKVTGKSGDRVFVDGTEYKKTSWIDVPEEPDCKLTMGQTYFFYTDRWGRIAAVRNVNSTEYTLSYLIKNINNPRDEICKMQIFESVGNTVTRDVAETVKVNEKPFRTPDDQKKELDNYVGQLIQVKLNEEGQVKEIYTADGTGSDLREITLSGNYNNYNSVIGNDYVVVKSTLQFLVPTSGDDDNFRIKTGLYDMPTNAVKISNVTKSYAYKDKFTIAAFIRPWDDDEAAYNKGTRASLEAPVHPYIVEKVETVWDDVQGEISEITVWYRGAKKVLKVRNDVVMKNISPVTGYYAAQSGEQIPANYCATLKEGDIIRATENMDGYVKAIELIFDYNADKKLDNIYVPNLSVPAAPNNGIRVEYKTVRGYVGEIDEGYFKFYAAKGDTSTINENTYEIFPDTAGRVVVYDTKTGKFSTGSMADALTYKKVGENASRVVLYSTYGTLQAAYIYK